MVKDRRGILVSRLEANHLSHLFVINNRVLLTDCILAAERVTLDSHLLLEVNTSLSIVGRRELLRRSSRLLRRHAAAEDLPAELVSFRMWLHDKFRVLSVGACCLFLNYGQQLLLAISHGDLRSDIDIKSTALEVIFFD